MLVDLFCRVFLGVIAVWRSLCVVRYLLCSVVCCCRVVVTR